MIVGEYTAVDSGCGQAGDIGRVHPVVDSLGHPDSFCRTPAQSLFCSCNRASARGAHEAQQPWRKCREFHFLRRASREPLCGLRAMTLSQLLSEARDAGAASYDLPARLTPPRPAPRRAALSRWKILGQRDNGCLTQVNRAPACAIAGDPTCPAIHPMRRLISIKPVLAHRRRFLHGSDRIAEFTLPAPLAALTVSGYGKRGCGKCVF